VPAHSAQREIHTTYGQREKIAFSNGSSIVLNAHSTLTYESNPPAGRPIHVTLQGEAYFATGEHSQPGDTAFTIQTPDGRVSDLGTQFVVSIRDNHTQVILKRGEVSIDQMAGNGGKSVLLHPNQMATFTKNARHIHIKPVNPAVYTSWTTNKLILDHTPLRVVANRLEHTFGVQVVVCRTSLRNQSISGSIKNGNLSVIAGAVAKALHTTATIKVDTVYIGCDGY
jgi:ferric-dicitrate binding protein FerR (iron transport regulator)